MQHKLRVETYVAQIQALRDQLEKLSQPFRVDPKTGKDLPFDKFSAKDWRRNTFGNALVRLRQIVEANFNFIETMGLLAVTRYIFELSVWLRLFQQDSRYALVYYRELLATQRRYYEDTLTHLQHEIRLLNEFEDQDQEETNRVIKNYHKVTTTENPGRMLRNAASRVDAEAGRHFSIYFDDAKINGYGYQAVLVEKQVIPKVEDAISQIDHEIQEYEENVHQDIRQLIKGRWQWKKMADKAGIVHEYNYIYSYASKLLHATPASLTTDQKNLEPHEMYIFLRYIHIKLLEIMDLAGLQPECRIKPMA